MVSPFFADAAAMAGGCCTALRLSEPAEGSNDTLFHMKTNPLPFRTISHPEPVEGSK